MLGLLRCLSALLSFLRSRAFALGTLAVLLAFAIYTVGDLIRAVYIVDDGETILTYTTETDANEILDRQGITVSEHDQVSFSSPNDHYLEVTIHRAFPVSITADGKTIHRMVTGGTVDQLLMEENLDLDGDDLINCRLDQALEEGDSIVIQRVQRQETVDLVPIAYEEVDKSTSLLRYGTSRLIQSGQEGEKRLTYVETTIDGVVHERQLVGEDVLRQPVSEITLVGDGSAISPLDFSAEFPLDENGIPIGYQEVLTDQSATGYSARTGARGASGGLCAPGMIAVNYQEIPYGTKMYITSSDGSFVYGYAVANDTGIALMDGRVDVDLFYDTYMESVLNSRRTVDVYILE